MNSPPLSATPRPSLVSVPPAAGEELLSLAKAVYAEHPKAVAAGGVALSLAVGWLVVRSVRRPRHAEHEGSGVAGVIIKSALFAAIKTIGVVELKRAARKVVGKDHSQVGVASAPSGA